MITNEAAMYMLIGTAVTVESFIKWKRQFDDEMLAKEVMLRKAGIVTPTTTMLPLSVITVGLSSGGGNNSCNGLSAAEISSLLGDEKPTGKQIFLMQMSGCSGGLGISSTEEEALLLEAEKEDYSEQYLDVKANGGVEDDEDDDEDYEPSVGSDDLDDDDEDFVHNQDDEDG